MLHCIRFKISLESEFKGSTGLCEAKGRLGLSFCYF
ncbi:hypothetical protein CUP0963 [Campylobacter upsaliensis RM3195]|nr:hypothetical protein CUP0963 [Campylobacter upsaliensis RM3195]